MEPSDDIWKALGLGAPARRALVNEKIMRVSDLAKFTQAQIEALHGMGPSTMPKLLTAMKEEGVKFRWRVGVLLTTSFGLQYSSRPLLVAYALMSAQFR